MPLEPKQSHRVAAVLGFLFPAPKYVMLAIQGAQAIPTTGLDLKMSKARGGGGASVGADGMAMRRVDSLRRLATLPTPALMRTLSRTGALMQSSDGW